MLTPLILPLLLSCRLTVFALTLPPMLTNLTADWTIPSDGNQNFEAHCPQDKSTRPFLPILQDCIRAIRLLPHSPYIGTFHIGGHPSLFQLPDSREYDSCTVMVLLHEDFGQEMDTWDDIRSAAMRILLACRLPFDPEGEQRTGGWITTGPDNAIVVELQRSRGVRVNGSDLGAPRGMNGVNTE